MNDYPATLYPEILTKPDRPHYCLLIDTHCDYFICVPYRSNILHNNAFHFKNTNRSKCSRSGLDYSKIAIIKDIDYLDDQNVIIDQDEYNNTVKNAEKIAAQATAYVDNYIAHINGTAPLHPKEYDRKYKYSTLKYYHKELELEQDKTTQQQNTAKNKHQPPNINYCGASNPIERSASLGAIASDCNTTDIANKLSESSKPKTRYDT